jgi:tripartite ATP-independent transporter DctM subunit
MALGNMSPDPVSVGQLFAGAMLPGLILVGLYLTWMVLKAVFDPASCPPLAMNEAAHRGLLGRVLDALVPPLALILAVLGSILAGVATPTESASVGAVGAMALAAWKRQLSSDVLRQVMRSTLTISSMVFVILLGASVFSLVFRGLGGENLVYESLAGMPGGVTAAVAVVMLVIFLLGFFLDTFEIIFIVVPIAAPVLIRLGADPIWLGVMIGVNLQTSFLTPPFGFALFYLRGVATAAVKTADIYRGAFPFVALQVIGLGILWLVPGAATALPAMLFADAPIEQPLMAPSVAGPTAPAGSPVADHFSDLFAGSGEQRTRPYMDDFSDLVLPR